MNINMKKIKIFAGIFWAVMCLLLILILFPGLNNLSASASRLPFMKINPNYAGGEIAGTMVSGSDTIEIRKPVFSGLIHERKTGFVQIDWRGSLPEVIKDTIDFDFDSKPDFYVVINRDSGKSSINAFNTKVGSLRVSVPTSYGWAIRVNLQK
jgi:hypothetical protein